MFSQMPMPGRRLAQLRSPPRHTAVGAALRDATRFDRSAVAPMAGLIAAIPVALVFGVAIAAGDAVVAATMGAGAMLVGVAWRTAGGRPPIALLAVDALLMALSTFLGSATGSLLWLHLLVVFCWSLLAGLLVAVGRRGAIVGTQAVIGLVVFGRFSETPDAALGLAGLVLAGGLAMVMFVALVRWPSPLRQQRDAVADACRALAELCEAPTGVSTIPTATSMDEARAALSAPMLFGDAAVQALRGLIDEASRLRIELRAIHVLLEQGSRSAPPPRAEARETLPRLERSAQTLRTMAAAIEGDDGALAQLEKQRDLEIPKDTDPETQAYLDRRLAALEGQLRAMARQVPAAARSGGLAQRRPRAGLARPQDGLRSDLALMRANATRRSPAGRHALRLAVVVLASELISEHVPLQRSYWIVVAAATALRPEFAATFTRGAERILGTCAGVALAGLIVTTLHPSIDVVVGIIGVLAWIAYSIFPASFAAGFTFITTLVVFLLDAVTGDTLAIAGDRLLDTLVGGAIGLAAYALWPTWSHKPARQALADALQAQRAYLAAVLASLAQPSAREEPQVAMLARRARIAYSTAQETVARSLAEPAAHQIDPEQSQGILGALRRIVSATHVLRTEAGREAQPALSPLATDLDRALALIAAELPAERSATSPPPPALTHLRERYEAFERAEQPQRDGLLSRELDELVDAVNSLAALADSSSSR
jgi:uncharacterized membrane protein YccC